MSQLRDLLKIRDFRYLWTAQVVSDFGDNLAAITLIILIQRLTGSTVAIAGLLVAIALPTLIFGTVAGVYVDRLDRRRVILVSDFVRAILVLGFLFVRSVEMVPLIFILAFLQAGVGTIDNPARAAYLPAVVGTDKLLAANSVSQTSRIIFNLLGTAAAGILAGVADTLAPAFILDSATFFASFLLISRIRVDGRPQRSEAPAKVWAEMKQGFGVMISSRPLRAVLISLSMTMLGLGAVNVLFIPFLLEDLMVSEAFLGAIEASQVAGMVISGTVVAMLAVRLRPSSMVWTGLIGIGVFVGAISWAQSVWHVMAFLFLVGLAVGPTQAGANTLSQTLVEDRMRGRVGGVLTTLISAANVVSMGLAGVAAAAIGTRNVFLASGVLVVATGVLSFWLFKGVREVESDVAGDAAVAP